MSSLRRTSYYVIVIVGAIMVHQAFAASLLGAGAADVFRRNSEAYALMVLVPGAWDLLARQGDPRRPPGMWGSRDPLLGRQTAWYTFLVFGIVVLQTGVPEAAGIDLPQSVITLGEAFVAAAVISLYHGWSRGFAPWSRAWGFGSPMVSVQARSGYYLAVVVFTVIVYQSWFLNLAGATAVDWLQVNAEAFAAALIIPAYFDLVAAATRPAVRLVWYPALVAAPLAIQGGVLDPVLGDALVGWLERTTEAFIAAFVVSAYFDVWRSGVDVHVSAPGDLKEDGR